jgi:hypothetical protein
MKGEMDDIVFRLRDEPPGWERAREAADEIERLRLIVRLNGLRAGFTHAEIDVVLTTRFGETK